MDKMRQGDEVHIIEWNTNFICWNVVHPELNQNKIWLQLTQYTTDELPKLKNYLGRYEAFFDACVEYKIVRKSKAEIHHVRRRTELPGSWLPITGRAIQSAVGQLLSSPKYDNLYILNTYQNYLKENRKKVELEILKHRYLNIPLCRPWFIRHKTCQRSLHG